MGTSKTFEITYFVGNLPGHYMSRVHADDATEAQNKLKLLIADLKRVWETSEIARSVASGGVFDLVLSAPSEAGVRSVIWTGTSDVTASAGRGHIGPGARVTVDDDGDVRVDMLVAGVNGTFAPLNDRDELLALRACVRDMAERLVNEEEVIDAFRASADAHALLARTAPTWRDVELEIFGGLRLRGQAREIEWLGGPALEVREDHTADREPVTYPRAAIFSSRWLTAAESAERAAERVKMVSADRVSQARNLMHDVLGPTSSLTTAEIHAAVRRQMPDITDAEMDDAFATASIERVVDSSDRWEQAIPY